MVRIASLTPREREVVSAICQGMHNTQIATNLFISEDAVRDHLVAILRKLDLYDRFELALYAYTYRLAHPA